MSSAQRVVERQMRGRMNFFISILVELFHSAGGKYSVLIWKNERGLGESS